MTLKVLGASLADYLLEKSRVCMQGDGERNFHVFYYLFAGLTDEEKAAYSLEDITDYHYIRGGIRHLPFTNTLECAILYHCPQLYQSPLESVPFCLS